jgi:hypothetical protein
MPEQIPEVVVSEHGLDGKVRFKAWKLLFHLQKNLVRAVADVPALIASAGI